jgi:hypothetical protein
MTDYVPPLHDYKVWIDTERSTEVISYLRSMTRLNTMEEEFCACRMASVSTALTLPLVVRWIVSRIRKSKRRRGHRSVRKYVVQRKLLLGVVNKRSLRASDYVLLSTGKLFSFVRDMSH